MRVCKTFGNDLTKMLNMKSFAKSVPEERIYSVLSLSKPISGPRGSYSTSVKAGKLMPSRIHWPLFVLLTGATPLISFRVYLDLYACPRILTRPSIRYVVDTMKLRCYFAASN